MLCWCNLGRNIIQQLHLPPKVVTRILKLEFIEMSELISGTWNEDGHASLTGGEAQKHLPRCPPVTDIMTWLQCYALLAVVLLTRYTKKALELWAYQSLSIREAKIMRGRHGCCTTASTGEKGLPEET